MDIDYSSTFLDILANGLTGAIWARSTAHITGTIVKFDKADEATSSASIFVNMK